MPSPPPDPAPEAGGRPPGDPPPTPPASDLPERILRPDSGGGWEGIRELWEYRDLLLLLTWRSIAVRYKQTVFGAAWALIQPLVTSGIFTVFLGSFAGIPSDDRPYFLFTLAAMVPWTFFQNALIGAATSLVDNQALISKVYFPRLLLPAAAVGAALVDLAVGEAALLVILSLRGEAPGVEALLLLPLVMLMATLALGAGAGLAAVNVRFRDVRFTIPFLLQCWMFATPVVYPLSVVPERYRALVGLNPLVGIVEGIRGALLGLPAPGVTLALSLALTLLALVLGVWTFQRFERSFADVV